MLAAIRGQNLRPSSSESGSFMTGLPPENLTSTKADPSSDKDRYLAGYKTSHVWRLHERLQETINRNRLAKCAFKFSDIDIASGGPSPWSWLTIQIQRATMFRQQKTLLKERDKALDLRIISTSFSAMPVPGQWPFPATRQRHGSSSACSSF